MNRATETQRHRERAKSIRLCDSVANDLKVPTRFPGSLASDAYAAVARARRRWYDRHPDARRRLARPVVSVGNLRVGGTGKTPMVAWLARELAAAGERPAILTRGYARTDPADGVVVASDGTQVLAPVERTGDEPQMLARTLTGVAVLVGSDRYLAGRLAESRLGCTVHLLDDGFQHLPLRREVDVLMMAPRDLEDSVLPGGRLRESLDAAAQADAVCVSDATDAQARQVASRLHVRRAFRIVRRLGVPRCVGAQGEAGGGERSGRALALPMPRTEGFGTTGPHVVRDGRRVLAVAGIAEPQRFFGALRADGWSLAGELAFPDHHVYGRRDIDRIAAHARAVGADVVMTTEKDAVRLTAYVGAGLSRPDLPLAVVPLVLDVEPGREMMEWLLARLEAARVREG